MIKVSQSEFLTTRDAARLLGVALATIQTWVESGVLPAWKTAGGHRRIPRSAVEELLNRQKAAIEATQPQQKVKVLVVEDDPVQLQLYQLRFGEWQLPIELLTAQDGFEGLIMMGRHNPDLVIIDLAMPGMDGFRLIKHLSEQYDAKKLKIIVVTGKTSEEIAAAGGLPGGIPVYPKPIPFPALRPIVESVISKRVT